jgi:hypothetical protein
MSVLEMKLASLLTCLSRIHLSLYVLKVDMGD